MIQHSNLTILITQTHTFKPHNNTNYSFYNHRSFYSKENKKKQIKQKKKKESNLINDQLNAMINFLERGGGNCNDQVTWPKISHNK